MALEIVKKEISLNVGQPNNFELLCAMQGDNKSFEITATLYDINKLYTINTDNIKIKGINPTGASIYKNVKGHTANTVTFVLTEDMLAYDGLLKLVLVLTESSTQLTTFPFVIKVVNSPGNTDADDMKTVSALVEEAQKWAMLSKSYAIGTNNEIREGDASDNSKYYYEQIKEMLDSGEIGNGKILYFDTYEEFQNELDAGKIEDETLICISERDDTGNSGEENTGKDEIDFTGNSLIFFHNHSNVYDTTDMKTWNNVGYNEYGYHYIPFGESNTYSTAYCNNMIFIINHTSSGNCYLDYTIRDFRNTAPHSKMVWYRSATSQLNSFGKMAYGNGHLIVVGNNYAYVIDDDTIISNRANNIIPKFQSMTGCENFNIPKAIEYGNNIFVITYDYKENNTTIKSKSFYTSDYHTWHELNAYGMPTASEENLKMVYGNNYFLLLQKGINRNESKKVNNIRLLNSNDLTTGFIDPSENEQELSFQDDNDNNTFYTDLIFDDTSNRFLIPFYNTSKSISGFYIYDCTNWSRTIVNKVIKIYNCIYYQGKLFGFTHDNHWISVDNIETYQYTDYGIANPNNENSYPFSAQNCSYVLIDEPLWSIDETNTTAGY